MNKDGWSVLRIDVPESVGNRFRIIAGSWREMGDRKSVV
jgi:hypothetical protein